MLNSTHQKFHLGADPWPLFRTAPDLVYGVITQQATGIYA